MMRTLISNSNNRNPFLKDYSQTTLLGRNYELIKGYNNSNSKQQNIKQNLYPHYQKKNNHQYVEGNNNHNLQQHNTIITQSTTTYNPFEKRTLNVLDTIMYQKINMNNNSINNDLYISQARSLSNNSRNNILVGSLQKSSFYKGLEEIGSKQLWKNQLQKQYKYQLKLYGPQTLRYQYHPNNQQPYNNNTKQPKSPKHINQSNSSNAYTFSNNKENKHRQYKDEQSRYKASKYSDRLQQEKKTPSFNNHVITSQYYGYQDNTNTQYNHSSSQDQFYIQKKKTNNMNNNNNNNMNNNKKSLGQNSKKKPSTFINQHINSNKKHHYSSSNQQRQSYYQQSIPQDRNQDLQTIQNLNINNNQQSQSYNNNLNSNNNNLNSHNHSHRQSNNIDPKRTSIQHIYSNYHHQESVSSGHGAPSQMYESGANFFTNNIKGHKFNNKEGPLSIKAFDDQRSQEWQNDQSISSDNSNNQHPKTLEYNNKIYHMIALV